MVLSQNATPIVAWIEAGRQNNAKTARDGNWLRWASCRTWEFVVSNSTCGCTSTKYKVSCNQKCIGCVKYLLFSVLEKIAWSQMIDIHWNMSAGIFIGSLAMDAFIRHCFNEICPHANYPDRFDLTSLSFEWKPLLRCRRYTSGAGREKKVPWRLRIDKPSCWKVGAGASMDWIGR